MGLAVVLLLLVNLPAATQAPVGNSVDHLGLNVTASPLDSLTLRQAIASAIDRRAVFEATRGRLPGGLSATGPANGWFPPSLPQHNPDAGAYPYDVAAARNLLSRAGFPEGRGVPELEVLYNQGPPIGAFRVAGGAVVKAQLEAVGIRVKLTSLPTLQDLLNRVLPGQGRQAQFQAFLFAWTAVSPTDDFLSRHFLQGGQRNAYGYRNADVTLLIANSLKETDATKRIAMLREAERLVLLDAPVVPVMYLYAP
ncbi:MAG: ABC transporter substrate-binding protein [Armatimonadota bacterium]